ncbi:cation-translocating P-type ATPase [Paracidovorax citrulli]|nr:cation-translocating P-type ATPase [Paracidovorax citrulli]ATG94867.1 heavy metal translocating P-type ATPase [Paracidovorax citrulli]PVY66298.1 Cu2+-exporting ATPase [Paracidovorax citrulli]QCX12034.1 Copper-exporting P-type ATPase A [Paracidovorax citrulli]REG69530.1 Cu2+-exporting ATPase [Paracidovorax citrulli]RLJ94084.1 Cu2+-exporting ATPase [Paracidovorax citrulli]
MLSDPSESPAASSAIDREALPGSPSVDGDALLDDPQEWPSFGRPHASATGPAQGVWDSHVVLQGMHCAACALTIEDALRAVPGVLQAEVSAATHRARVVWDAGVVRPSRWFAAVARAGYPALPAMDALAREQRRREGRRALWRWLVAGFCMMQVMMYAWPAYVAQPGDLTAEMERLLRWASWVITLPMMIFSCGPFFSSALRDLRQRRVSMDLPVALGMGITFVVSTAGTFDPAGPFGREVYYDSLTMFVFFLLTGRWLEMRLRDRTAGALEAVMNRLPDSVERRGADGTFTRVGVRRLAAGDVVRVLPGEAFPADGRIDRGSTQVDEALLTGESTPLPRAEGAAVTAGSYNLSAPVEVRVERVGGDTRFAEIVALMEAASAQKPRLAQLADRIARPFLVGVLLAAGLAAAWWWRADPEHALMVAVAVLIVTCPCALSLATPVAMLTAAGALARQGVLVRNLQALETLAAVDTVVFDKTGTLTRDGVRIAGVHPAPGFEPADALALAAALARHSLHPLSRALVEAAGPQGQGAAARWRVSDVREVAGQGLVARVDDGEGRLAPAVVRLGRAADSVPVDAQQLALCAQPLHGSAGDRGGAASPAGWPAEIARFGWREDLRSDAAGVIVRLRGAGLAVELLSGDRDDAVARVAAGAGIEVARGGCAPQGKLDHMRALQAAGRHVAMVGDGLNDGPVLAGAHVSFAFGRAVPLARSRSDFVVMGEQLAMVERSVRLARRTLRVVRQNLAWAAAYNALCVPLAVAGWMPAWLAGLGMALSSLLVVANAARLARGAGSDAETAAMAPDAAVPPDAAPLVQGAA